MCGLKIDILRTVCVLVVFVVKFGVCVGTFRDRVIIDTNTISEDERRGADPEDLKSIGLQDSSPYKSRFYLPSYDGVGFDHQATPGQYLPPYHETGNHPGGYGYYQDPGYGHQSFRAPSGPGGKHTSSYGGLALKGLLIPLAGIALLGAAAALSTNPVLLQLGVLNGRRRRSITDVYPDNPRTKPEKNR